MEAERSPSKSLLPLWVFGMGHFCRCTWGVGGTKMRRRCERKITEVAGSSGTCGEESPTLRLRKDDVWLLRAQCMLLYILLILWRKLNHLLIVTQQLNDGVKFQSQICLLDSWLLLWDEQRAFPAPPTYMEYFERQDKGRRKMMAFGEDKRRREQPRCGKERKSLRIGGW